MEIIAILSALPSGVYSLVGAVVGAVLGFAMATLRDWYENRYRLFYSLRTELMEDDRDISKSTKAGPSGFVIQIYNCGRTPVIIENISLYGNPVGLKIKLRLKHLWKKVKGWFQGRKVYWGCVDSLLSEPLVLLPMEKNELELSRQDYEVIRRWCSLGIQTVRVEAYTMDGKKIKGVIDAYMIWMQVNVNPAKAIIREKAK